MDAMMVPTNREENARVPHRSFKIKPDFGNLRIGICEPTIWKAWRKSGRINADAERFMVRLACICLRQCVCTDNKCLACRISRGYTFCWACRADTILGPKVRHGGTKHDRDGG